MFQHFYRLLLAIVSGILLTLAFPHVDQGWIAFVALVPFLRTFPYARTRSAFGHGFVFGMTYFAGLLYWIAVFSETKIGSFGVLAWLILSMRESFWIGLFAAVLNSIWSRTSWAGRTVAAASLWTLFEWLRQLGPLGFGWGDLAYSQWRFLPFIQLASVTGIWGLSWLIVFVNTAVASARPKLAALSALIVSVVCIGGFIRLETAKPHSPEHSAAALQADLSEDVPYTGLRPSSSSYFFGTLDDFDQMAGQAVAGSSANICVTAETSIPGYPNLDIPLKSMLRSIAIRHNIVLIVGARDTDYHSQEDTNSVFAFLPDGTEVGPYNKQQLVPFGEYVPFRSTFPFLNSFHVLDFDMHAGPPGQPPLNIGLGRKAGVAVCYESTYPRFLVEQVRRGATFDIVVTDDTWYGKTAAAKQHLAMSILRAVETDRSLVRCASTGISAIISPMGKVDSSADIFTKQVVVGPVEQRTDITPFVRFGDWFPMLCAAGVLVQLVNKPKRGSQDD